MGDIKKKLGKKIKMIRKARNMTQEQLAEMVDIGTPNISYIENGKFAPSIENLQKIASALEVEPWELYKFDDFKNIEEIKKNLFTQLENDEQMLKIIYEIFLLLKFKISKN